MVASETMLQTHHHHLPGRPSMLSTDSVEVSSTASRFPRRCRGFLDGVEDSSTLSMLSIDGRPSGKWPRSLKSGPRSGFSFFMGT